MKSLLCLSLALTSFSGIASTSASLILRGQVPQILSLSLTAETLASNLPLDKTQSSTKVGQVTERSNSSTGYKVSVESANKGKLVRVNGSEQFPYTLAYHGQNLNLAGRVDISYPQAQAVTSQKDVTISYTGVPHDRLVAGDYTDTVTFTIAAN
jgi:hypothetical protein